MERKDLEELITKALLFEKSLRRVGPSGASSTLSKMVVIPDWNRSIEDIKEDLERKPNISIDDYDIWYNCMVDWLPCLSMRDRKMVIMRLRNKEHKMGWKRIAINLKEEGLTTRVMDRTTLWLWYRDALNEIIKNFF